MGIYDLFSRERIHHQQVVDRRPVQTREIGVRAKSETQAVMQFRPKSKVSTVDKLTSFRKDSMVPKNDISPMSITSYTLILQNPKQRRLGT